MKDRNELLSQLHIDRDASPSKRFLPWIIGGGAVALIAIGLAWFFHEPAPLSVNVQMARMATLDSSAASVLDATGYVVARRSATVSSKVTGKVVEILIEEGMSVEKNQILAKLDDQNAQKALAVAEAEVKAAKAQVEEARAHLVEAKLNYERNALMAERKLVSQASFDLIKANYDSLKAQLNNRLENVEVSQRLLAQQKQYVDDLTIRAPFSGVVISKDSQPGEMISPISAGGGFTRTGICTLVDMSSLEIELDVNESYIQRVRAGQQAEAILEAYPEWKIPAKVAAIIPTADRQKATVKVRVTFESLDTRILPDMGVKVSFLNPEPPAKEKPKVELGIRVPTSAVRSIEEHKYVFVLKNDVVEQRKVKLNASYGSDAYISEGLNAGEDFVVDASPPLLKNGAKVIRE